MADGNTQAGKDRAPQSDPGREAEGERSIPNEDLLDGSSGLLGVQRHELAAALSTSRKQTHTLSEARKLVEKVLKQESQTSAVEDE